MTSGPQQYRPDIDGLRAIAVLLVMGFHAFPGRVPAGFIGVDVFFVISGYLITGIIVRDLREGRFSLARFYERRVRRIFPALAVVLCVCLLAGSRLLSPSEFADLGWHAAAGAAFVSNFALLAQSGYFAAASESKPLLHLWSLGVEEQFYLVWPLTLAFVASRTPRPLRVVAAIAAASLVACLALTPTRPEAAFYGPFTRLWELLAGGLLALRADVEPPLTASGGGRAAGPALRSAATAIGLSLVATAALALDASLPFPGWRAALPVAGTVLVIAAGPHAWLNRTVLARRALVFVGLISYPLYLWHWPALALLLSLDLAWSGGQERIAKLVALAASVLAAAATYWWIERPVRLRRKGSVLALCLALTVPFLAGAVVFAAWRARVPVNRQQREIARQLEQMQNERALLYRDRVCFLDADQDETAFSAECGAEAERRPGGATLLWGDSHAAHLAPGIRALGVPAGFAQFTATSCPPVLGYAARGRPHCRRLNDWVLGWVKAHRPHTVLLAAAWPHYDGYAAVAGTIDALRALGVPRVVLVGPPVSFSERVPELLARLSIEDAVPERLPSTRLERLRGVDRELRALATGKGIDYASLLEAVCNERGCLVALGGTASGLLIFDQSHVMPAGSRLLAERALAPYLR